MTCRNGPASNGPWEAMRVERNLALDAPPLAFVELPGVRMAYREWGRSDAAEAVVLIHGITSSSLSWVRVGPALGRHARVIAVDLKGHGDSDRPPAGYRIQDQAAEVAALCEVLGLRQPAVIGHSWGGAIALVLATSTDRVSRLVLEDPAIDQRRRTPEQRAQTREDYAATVGLDYEAALALARANLALGWTEQDVAGKADAAMKGSPAAVRAVFDENEPWDFRDRLVELRCPTLLLLAEPERGGIVSSEAVARARANPRIQVATVPGADHNIHRTRYGAFLAAVEAFLAPAAD